jgi:hypothetical protein
MTNHTPALYNGGLTGTVPTSSILTAENIYKVNAILIAAAPEMLAELEKQVVWLEHIKPQVSAPDSVMIGFEQSIKSINKVIAKAKGLDNDSKN